MTDDKNNIFYREPGNEYYATCTNSQNTWAHCILEKDHTLTFIDGDWRQGGVLLSKDFYKHRHENYWEAVKKQLEWIKEDAPNYYQKIIDILKKYKIDINTKINEWKLVEQEFKYIRFVQNNEEIIRLLTKEELDSGTAAVDAGVKNVEIINLEIIKKQIKNREKIIQNLGGLQND